MCLVLALAINKGAGIVFGQSLKSHPLPSKQGPLLTWAKTKVKTRCEVRTWKRTLFSFSTFFALVLVASSCDDAQPRYAVRDAGSVDDASPSGDDGQSL